MKFSGVSVDNKLRQHPKFRSGEDIIKCTTDTAGNRHDSKFQHSHSFLHDRKKDGRSLGSRAVPILQALVRGFLHRRKCAKKVKLYSSSINELAASKIQRWWRCYLSEQFRLILQRSAILNASIKIKKALRRYLAQRTYCAWLQARTSASILLQRHFRKTRMLKIIPILRIQRLTNACLLVQRHYREHKRWQKIVEDERQRVFNIAKAIRDNYLFSSKSRDQVELARRQSTNLFLDNTNIFARKLAFSKRKSDVFMQSQVDVTPMTAAMLEQMQVSLKAAQSASKRDFWELDAKPKDSHEVEKKLEECRSFQQKTLDLSSQAGGLQETLNRWPYGLQGMHSLFHITALFINGHQIAGLPLDFYSLTCLRELHANSNRIKSILPQIRNLKELEVCWFHNNILNVIPCEMGMLSKLTQLSLSNNQLAILPGELGYLPALSQLKLDGNPWISPPLEIVDTVHPASGGGCLDIVFKYLRAFADCMKQGDLVWNCLSLKAIPENVQHLKALTFISMERNSIHEIPDFICGLTRLCSLRLSKNRIERIPRNLKKLLNLKYLDLSSNLIGQRYLSPESLFKLTNLEVLHLMDNPFDSPPCEVLTQPACTILDYLGRFIDSTSLGVLNLSSFRLKSFPKVDVHKSVRVVQLNDNMFRNFPLNIVEISKLTELNVSNNLLSSVPRELASATMISILNLSSNSLSEFPNVIGNLPLLTKLVLNQNQLTELPACIHNLTNLHELSLSHNLIQDVCQEISSLPLWDLNLSFNKIERIAHIFKGMTQLRMLNIEGNRIRSLPVNLLNCNLIEQLISGKNPLDSMLHSVSGFGAMRVLKLSDCKIRAMPLIMSAARELQLVEMERNELDTFPIGLCTLRVVNTLRLKQNFIIGIPPEISKLSSLTCLDLSHNKVSVIACEVKLLVRLTIFALSNNCLTALPPFPPYTGAVFGLLSSLESLDLRDNRLCFLPNDLVQLRRLKHVALDGNPFSKDAILRRMVEPAPAVLGELAIRFEEAEVRHKNDARVAETDRFMVAEVGAQVQKTDVAAGLHTTRWGQSLCFPLWPSADTAAAPPPITLRACLWRWQSDGAHERVGSLSLDLSAHLLPGAGADTDPAAPGQPPAWHQLEPASRSESWVSGRVRLGWSFRRWDRGVGTILRYLDLRSQSHPSVRAGPSESSHSGPGGPRSPASVSYSQHSPATRSAGPASPAVAQKRDVASRQVKEWLGRTGSSLLGRRREPWEDLDVFFAPSGVVNLPWEVGVERFQRQCDAMREYLPLKARQDRHTARLVAVALSESGRSASSRDGARAGRKGAGDRDREGSGAGSDRDGGDLSSGGEGGDSWDRRSTRAIKRELGDMFRDDMDGPDR